MTMTAEQFDVVQKISTYIGAYWFCIHQDESGTDYVYDSEENEVMSLADGIELLKEGIDFSSPLDDGVFTQEEIDEFNNLAEQLGL